MTGISAEIPSELQELIDPDPIRAAEAEIDHARLRYQDAADMARGAEAAVVEAHRVIPELTQRAVAGERVSAATVARAHQRARDAALYRDFCQEVARRLLPDEREAEGRLARAKAQAFAPLFEHAVGLRIAAGKRADEVASTPYKNGDPGAYEQAHQEWIAATRIMNLAIRAGARHPNATFRDNWPSTEHAERSLWGREIVEEAAA